jgi:hypothetical protein
LKLRLVGVLGFLVLFVAITGPSRDSALDDGAAKPLSTTTTSLPSLEVAAPTLQLGITHTEQSIDTKGVSPDAVARVETRLGSHPSLLQNVHIMGWGVGNPEPSPGKFDWSSLDRRIDVVRRTGGTPVITLCCAPDWMKGGPSGRTDWTKLATAPAPEHYGDFAELAKTVALRYPDVTHFLVWNELKGFWDATAKRWRYEDYTALYNMVFDAVRSVRPNSLIGGPYVVMDSWAPGSTSHPSALQGPWGVVDQRALDVVDYWLAHAHGADFIAVDGSVTTKDKSDLVSPEQGAAKFAAITQWLRQRTSLPVWWAELYPIDFHNLQAISDATVAAAWDNALRALEEAGAVVVLYWEPQSNSSHRWLGLWTSTYDPLGGLPTATWTAVEKWLR